LTDSLMTGRLPWNDHWLGERAGSESNALSKRSASKGRVPGISKRTI
jgi:hypothetical protein